MKIDVVHHWMGDNLRKCFEAAGIVADGPFEITVENLAALMRDNDVMLREMDGQNHLYLDHKGRRFSQR